MAQPPPVSSEESSGGSPTSDLRSLAQERLEEARADQRHARTMAKRHEAAEYVVGVVAAIAGVLAGAAFIRYTLSEWVSLIALVAGLAAAIGTFLNSRHLKNRHWSRHAGLGRLAQDYETLIRAPELPTKAEMREFSERWEQWHTGSSD